MAIEDRLRLLASRLRGVRCRFGTCALAVTVASTLLQAPSLGFDEVIDDHMLLHSAVERGCGNDPAECFGRPVFRLYYRPMLSASFAVAVGLHGTTAWVHHLHNLLLHGLMVGLTFWFLRLLFGCGRIALLGGTLFALHPLQVPVTTFIGGRTDTLALLFLMVFGIGAMRAGEQLAKGASVAAPAIISAIGFGAAVFTKEQVLPLVLLTPLLWRRGWSASGEDGTFRGLRWWWVLYLAPIGAYMAQAYRVVPRNAYEPAGWGPLLHVEMVGRTLWYYAKALSLPVVNTLHQSTAGHWDRPQVGIALLGLVCAGFWLLALRWLWQDRALRLCWLWTTLTLLPCLNVVPIPSQFVAPYRAVIPALGTCGLLGWLFATWSTGHHRRTALPAFGALVGAYAGISVADLPHWRDDIAVVRMEVIADPDYIPAQAGLAGVLQARARTLEQQGRVQEARDHYERARKQYDRVLALLFPHADSVETRIARVRSPELYRFIRGGCGLRYRPLEVVNSCVRGSGGTHQMLGRYAEAIADYRVALAAKPADIEVRDHLAYLYMETGQTVLAEATLRETQRMAPAAFRQVWLGELLARMGRRDAAREALLEGMMHPDFASLPGNDRQRALRLYNALSARRR
ncbi:MAG: hypothetical protein RMJ43_02965 [Chloroherpetonaceae bacterium]|nr:hypothetical protein [Chthonomonadaceae bacterium]MDW8206770.1 hypothetical protein [Chloroherpetonaceae bacterium]